jgi:hypothetical protein
MDSCAIFYIGGNVECQMPWNIDRIGEILLAAVHPREGPQSRQLHAYSGDNHPGKMWYCYKSEKGEKANCRSSLEDKLKDLLQPSTDKSALDSMGDANPSLLPAHLRLKQKELDQNEWFVDSAEGVIHNGAHFPLCMFTKNSSHRSANAHARRQDRWPYEWQWWAWQHEAKVKANKDKTAVAEQEAWTAVVEGPSSPAWMKRSIAASSWETASSWLPTRDGPNCDGEAWDCEQSIGWPYDQPGSDLNWSRSKWHGRYATERSKNWKQ